MSKKMRQETRPVTDVEINATDEAHLTNITVRNLTWRGIHVEKRSWKTDARPAPILLRIDGHAEAGRLTQHRERTLR